MAERWVEIGLGLGGNLGDPPTAIRAALDALAAGGQVRVGAVSSLYRTKPWGPVPQPDFANACALAETDLAPRALLTEVKRVEAMVGRVAGERWGPRAIDVDILAYDGVRRSDEKLTIPHARLNERAFVLVPLAEIDSAFVTARDALPATDVAAVERIGAFEREGSQR